jgi:hypothetical protein
MQSSCLSMRVKCDATCAGTRRLSQRLVRRGGGKVSRPRPPRPPRRRAP